MYSFHLTTAAALLSALLLLQPSAALQLNITALGAADQASTLECWQMDTPFSISAQQGTAGSAQLQLGNTSTMSYSVLPAQFDAGVHNAPANQYVLAWPCRISSIHFFFIFVFLLPSILPTPWFVCLDLA